MKKLKISLVLLSFNTFAFGQVGINTSGPAATLDITAKNAAGTSTNPEGLLVPRVDREKAQSMTSVATSTLIYVNAVSTGTQTGTTANIDAVGFYYFDGSLWQKLKSSGSGDNIYTTDGTLGGNRMVTQGTNTLGFTSNAVNGFSVDGTTLSVDAANDRVGVGTNAPTASLEVNSKTTGISGVKMTQFPSISVLATDASGNVISGNTTSTGSSVTKQRLVPASSTVELNTGSGLYSFRYSLSTTGGYWQMRLNDPVARTFNIWDVEYVGTGGTGNATVYQVRTVKSIPGNTWTNLDNNVAGGANEYNTYHVYDVTTGVIIRLTCTLSDVSGIKESMILEEF
ncbi:hypothetical protein CLU96_4706 [Chryseobacterium sp. 52]|uniref:hypothetical protein n=1 Tax=Chryseobacterium sp. 52 TaxID=2035213 RepID=UPI000C1864D4|nr:hypothetical protein [Chryseobacterium sp. 52]PIF47639.1 hypothetical protein CLU96_4706 [Chryseobacterium sp. 52]